MANRTVSCSGNVTNTGNVTITVEATLSVDYTTNGVDQFASIPTQVVLTPGQTGNLSPSRGVVVNGGDVISAWVIVAIVSPQVVPLLNTSGNPVQWNEQGVASASVSGFGITIV